MLTINYNKNNVWISEFAIINVSLWINASNKSVNVILLHCICAYNLFSGTRPAQNN